MQYYARLRRLDGADPHAAAWALLAELYRETVGGELPPVTRGPLGKPDFAEGPWHFSLAHSQRHALAVLAREIVGADAEEADRQASPALAGRILSAAERAAYRAAADRNRYLLTAWVLKEARVKAVGGSALALPTDTDVQPGDPRVTETDGCLWAVAGAGE